MYMYMLIHAHVMHIHARICYCTCTCACYLHELQEQPPGYGRGVANQYRELIQDERTLQEHHAPHVQGTWCMH